jgi:membrane fusion protein (multidrug efflux system)
LDADLAALQVAQANLENRIIRAPFDGQIGIVQVDIGDLINAGTPIATIDNTALMETEFTVPEIQLPKLQQGMSIEARSDAYPDTVFQGIVSAIDTRIDPNSRAIRLKADIPNDDNRLKSGMLMKVNILQSTRQGLALPEKALMNAGEEITVFKVGADKKAQQTKVTTGIRMAGLVEITSGLSEGDQVIIEGQMKTQDKSEVKVTATKTIEDSIQAAMDYAVPRKQKALIEADEIVEPKTSETQP